MINIDKLFNDLYVYEKELEEYSKGVNDSYVRDLENTIETTKNKINTIINKKVHEYSDNWLNYDDELLNSICKSVFSLYLTDGCYEDIDDCISNVFAIYESESEE